MRLDLNWEVVDPYDLEMYLSIWNDGHEYVPMNNREFCLVCRHSKLFHCENKIGTKND